MSEVLSRNSGSDNVVDAYTSIFEPDVMLPSQLMFRDEDGVVGGERQLMAAILSDGIEAYIAECMKLRSLNFDKKKSTTSDALDWVETKDYSYVFSFDNVCSSLGIDPDYLRTGLIKYVRLSIENSQVGEGAPGWKRVRRPRKH